MNAIRKTKKKGGGEGVKGVVLVEVLFFIIFSFSVAPIVSQSHLRRLIGKFGLVPIIRTDRSGTAKVRELNTPRGIHKHICTLNISMNDTTPIIFQKKISFFLYMKSQTVVYKIKINKKN